MACRVPEENEDNSYYVLREYDTPEEHLECISYDGSSVPLSFSFDDGVQLQGKVDRLEKELETLSAKIGSLSSRSNDEANEEMRARQLEERRLGQLISENDAMKKEISIRKDNEYCLRDQLHRAVSKAREEREALEREYEQKFLALKSKYEGDSNKAPLRLISELESQNICYKKESIPGKATREVQFTVVLVPNNDVGTGDSKPSCSHILCYSCKEPYQPDSSEGLCFFHPLPPLSRSKWEKDWVLEVDSKKYQNYSYWACCNTLAKKRPIGCCRGRHHQRWEADILLKQAMQEDHWNTQNMLQRSKSTVQIFKE